MAFRYVHMLDNLLPQQRRGDSDAKLHLLEDNEDLDPGDYPAIQALIDQARQLHLGAASYIASEGLDPEIFLPGNIWAHLNNESGFTDWSYDIVNYSRALSPFSGFHMMLWGRQDIPGDMDEDQARRFYAEVLGGKLTGSAIGMRLKEMGIPARISASRSNRIRFYSARRNLVRTYERLVAMIPERFRLAAPKRGGEMGLLHNGRILNPDVLIYQSRINALYGSGTLDMLDRIIAERGSANYLEIGPGHCFFAHVLRQLFKGRLNIFLIDLPFVIANGIAYLSCAAGVGRIGLATQQHWPSPKPYIFLPNYLLPRYAENLPRFDLVHNALSLNEMTAKQVGYYVDFIGQHLNERGIFHLAGGKKYLAYHQDALRIAQGCLPLRKSYSSSVEGTRVLDSPHSFFARKKKEVR